MSIIDRFSKNLTAIEYPKEKTSWNIAGILKDRNATINMMLGICLLCLTVTFVQKGLDKYKADKMVLEFNNQWLILDLEELCEYIRREDKKKVYVEDLVHALDWTIYLNK
jgi:tetrahydromethanopterin S-methyltransferase subunit B